jgi:hypothetical protein
MISRHREARIEIQLAERGLGQRIGFSLGNGINAGRRYSAFIASVFAAVASSTGTRRVSPTIADPNAILTNPIVAAMTAAPIKPERTTMEADM